MVIMGGVFAVLVWLVKQDIHSGCLGDTFSLKAWSFYPPAPASDVDVYEYECPDSGTSISNRYGTG